MGMVDARVALNLARDLERLREENQRLRQEVDYWRELLKETQQDQWEHSH